MSLILNRFFKHFSPNDIFPGDCISLFFVPSFHYLKSAISRAWKNLKGTKQLWQCSFFRCHWWCLFGIILIDWIQWPWFPRVKIVFLKRCWYDIEMNLSIFIFLYGYCNVSAELTRYASLKINQVLQINQVLNRNIVCPHFLACRRLSK